MLGRYIAREFIAYFLSCLLSLVFISLVFAALAEIELLGQEDGFNIFIDSLLSGIPLLIEIIAPISVLIATILTYISLSKSSESVAMMAAGVSLFQLVRPILLVGTAICLFLYFNQSYLAPWWGADKRSGVVRITEKSNIWRFYQGKLFFFKGISSRRKVVKKSKTFEFQEGHEIHAINDRYQLRLVESKWESTNGDKTLFNHKNLIRHQSGSKVIRADSFPVVFNKELSHPKYSDFSSIISEIRIKLQGAVNYEDDLFALYQKLASFFSIYIMILLALPFSLYSGRDTSVRSGIVISIILGFTYWLMDQIFISLNGTGLISIEISAFGANVIFMSLSVFLIYFKKI